MKSALLLHGVIVHLCTRGCFSQQFFLEDFVLNMYSVAHCRQSYATWLNNAPKKCIMLLILSEMSHEMILRWIWFLLRVWKFMLWFILKWLTLCRGLGRGATYSSKLYGCFHLHKCQCLCNKQNTSLSPNDHLFWPLKRAPFIVLTLKDKAFGRMIVRITSE